MTRTDPEIARDITQAMKIDLRIPVDDGCVTLDGTVDWNDQREAAESCARKVHGVRGVANKIAVKPRASPMEVKAKIEDALRRSAEIDARRITVSGQDGTITLSGNVRSWNERDEAECAAWAAPGARHRPHRYCFLTFLPAGFWNGACVLVLRSDTST